MRLTTKARFAVTAMLDIALCGDDAPVTLAEVSERRKISLSYLEQLFTRLRRHNLVEGFRGPGGGYRITVPLQQISITSIIKAVDEPIDATQCNGRRDCNDDGPCLTHDLWQSLNEIIYEHLSNITLADVAEKKVKPASGQLQKIS